MAEAVQTGDAVALAAPSMHPGFADHLQELFAGLGSLRLRPMFGGQGVYLDGRMFGLVMDDTLYLKTDAASEAAFRAAGGEAFVWRGKPRTLVTRYWSPPAEALESAQAMRPWAQRALAAAQAQATRVRRKR